jgi:NAD(P)-dependent dehydrogenase (short-subunit alcohol dehydrogenase family)
MGKVSGAILITGASTGIGRACALELARLGYDVFAGVRSREAGDALRAVGGERIKPLTLDVTNTSQISAALQIIEEQTRGRGLRALVNNAGIAVPGPLEIVPIADLRRQLDVNTIAAVAMTQAALPLLRRAPRPATIVNMSSISGRFSMPLLGAYAASKYALEAISDALRLELRPWGIRVVIIEPGQIATPIWEKTLRATMQSLEAMPTAQVAPYQPLIDMVSAQVHPGMGIPAERVVRVVTRAITARHPRARYVVGIDARVQLVLACLPTWLRDWLLARALPPFGDVAEAAHPRVPHNSPM